MRQVAARLGSVVEVTASSPTGGRHTESFRVVSQVSLPTLGGGVDLGTGAVFSIKGFEDAACPPNAVQKRCQRTILKAASSGVLASVVSGPRGRSDIRHYLTAYQSIVTPVVAPTSLINFGEAINFPLIVGGIVAAYGAATLFHLLLVSVSRRRRELGLLEILGFVNRQVIFIGKKERFARSPLG